MPSSFFSISYSSGRDPVGTGAAPAAFIWVYAAFAASRPRLRRARGGCRRGNKALSERAQSLDMIRVITALTR